MASLSSPKPTRWLVPGTDSGVIERSTWRTLVERATIVAMSVEPLRAVRDHLSEFVDRAEREHERVVVTRNGRPAAVLIGYDDLAALEETLEILSDPESLAGVREARDEVTRGDVVRGVDAVRALRPRS
jgi:prevent-host-death family protein